MGSEGAEDQRRHTAVISQNGRLKTWSESRGKHGIALDGEDWYDVWHGRLIITPDGTAEEEEQWLSWKQVIFSKCSMMPAWHHTDS